ncbi:MAG: hypothetical protein ACXIUV_12950 [Alkalilacustris sp.]
MTEALRVLIADMQRGMSAPARPLMLGALGGLGFSAPAIVALLLTIGPLAAIAVGVAVQLLAGYAIAGRIIRRG